MPFVVSNPLTARRVSGDVTRSADAALAASDVAATVLLMAAAYVAVAVKRYFRTHYEHGRLLASGPRIWNS